VRAIHTDAAAIRSTFSYNPKTGSFVRKNRARGPAPVGQFGSDNGDGYYKIRFNGKKYFVHVLAWVHFYGAWPLRLIDHIDGNSQNNAITNLRLATHAQNCWNRRRRSDNKVGAKGVCWDKQRHAYRVQLVINGKRVFQKITRDLDDAKALYAAALAEHAGSFGRAD